MTKEEKTSRRDNVLVFYGRLMEKYQMEMNRMQIGEKSNEISDAVLMEESSIEPERQDKMIYW